MNSYFIKSILLIAVLLIAELTNAQSIISIGAGTGSSSSVPIASWYNSSATESLYLGSEIGATGNISKIAFNKASGTSTTSPHVKIYLKNTSVNNLGTTNYSIGIAGFSNYTLVYDGILPNGTTSGWMEVTLSTPFHYASTSQNLSVLVVGSTCISSGRPQYRYTTSSSERLSSTFDDGNLGCGGSDPWNESKSFAPKFERPNIRLEISPVSTGCDLPTLLSSSGITANTATITWIPPSSDPADGYEYYFSTSSTTPLTSFAGTPVAGTGFSLTTLSPATTYYLWVRSVCSGILKSNWTSAISFTTSCAIETLPLSQGFNSTSRPPCWTELFIPTGGSGISDAATHIQYVTTSSSPTATPFEGTGMVKFNAYSINSGTQKRLQSPAISTISIASVDVSFQWYHSTLSSSSNDRVQVQYSLDGTTWMNAGSEIKRYGTSNAWEAKTITLPVEAGNKEQVKIGFLFIAGGGYNMYLDEVKIQASPTCITPTGLTINTTTANTADISWTASVTHPDNGYEYYYSTSSTTPTSITTPSGSSLTNSATIDGLSPSTTYHVWVRAFCDTDDKSNWTPLSVTFTTPCSPASIPFFEGFEFGYTHNANIAGCWSQLSISGTKSWTTNSSITSYNRAPRTGTWNAFLEYSNDDWMMIPVQLEAGKNYEFSMYARQDATSGATLNVYYGTSATALAMSNSIIANSAVTNGTYQKKDGLFSVASDGVYYIGIKATLNSSPWYISIDDIAINEVNCIPPISLTSNSITHASAIVSWSDLTTAPDDGYEYYYSTSNITPAAATTASGNTSTQSATLYSLLPNTNYYVWTRSLCSSTSTSEWSTAHSFRTKCIASSIPYTENFDALSIPNVPDCYSIIDINSGGSWATSNSYRHSTPNAIRINSATGNNNDLFFTNGLNLLSGQSYRLTFRYKVEYSFSYKSDLSVFLSSDNTTITEATNIFEFNEVAGPASGPFIEQRVDFTPTVEGVYYIGFLAENKAGLYIDDINISNAPTCDEPTALTIGTVTHNTAAISWAPPATTMPSSYDYYISTISTAPTETSTISGTSTTNNATITGLSGSTTYYVWVRSVCGTEDNSIWSIANTFTTACAPVSIPYFEGFETGHSSAASIGNCWTQQSVLGSSSWISNTSGTTANRTPRTGSWNAYLQYNNQRWMFKTVYLEAAKNYEFKMYARQDMSDASLANITVAYGNAATSVDMTHIIIPATNIQNGDYQELFGLFNVPADGVYTIGIIGYAHNSIWYLSIDDISITEAPNCVKPVNIALTERTGTTASITWEDYSSSPDNGYEYVISTSNTTPTGTGIPTTAPSVAFDDLSIDTDYYLYVRSICSEEDFSDWEIFSFDTKYCPISFQYTDYYINSVSSSSGISNFENITNAHSPTGYGNYATSHQVNQEAGKDINISININATSSNKIKAYVDWNQSLTFDESEQVIYIDNNTFFSNPTNSNSTITIPVGTPEGAYRLRIVLDHTHSASACGDWNNGEAEDYTINVIAPCNTPTGLSASYISDNGATISWTAIEGISEYEYYLNKTGVSPTPTTLGTTISSTVSNIVIDENTTYHVWVRSICAATHKSEWSAVLNFNNICTAIENVSISEITANAATIIWDPTVSNSYEYIISTENTPPTLTSTGTSTSINTVTTTELAGNNDYYVWVRNICSSTLKGSWTAVSTFRTQCETASELPLSDQTIVHTQENGETLDYKDDNCKILNSIVAHEGDLGTVTSSVKVQPAFESSEGKPYIGRYYDIHTTINNAAIITLYFSDEDINSYNTLVADSEAYPAITAGSTDLKIYIYHSEPASGINGIEAYSQLAEDIEVVIPSLSYNSETGLWQLTFETSGFSGFFVGTEVSTPLSIDILGIDAYNEGSTNIIKWTTQPQNDIDYFEIEKSTDGRSFGWIETVSKNESNTAYLIHDWSPASGTTYYRIRSVYNNHQMAYTHIVQAYMQTDKMLQVNVYPNPAKNIIHIKASNETAASMEISLIGINGQSLKRFRKIKNEMLTIDLKEYPAGVYYISYSDGDHSKSVPVVKQ